MKASEGKTIRIPKPLWRQLKMASAEHDIKIQDLVITALESKLREIENKRMAKDGIKG